MPATTLFKNCWNFGATPPTVGKLHALHYAEQNQCNEQKNSVAYSDDVSSNVVILKEKKTKNEIKKIGNVAISNVLPLEPTRLAGFFFSFDHQTGSKDP